MYKYLLYILCFYSAVAFGQAERGLIRDGNSEYEKGNYSEAEVNYKKALEKNGKSVEGVFNLGDAYFKQKKADEAIDQFRIAAETTQNKEIRSKAYHNLGNTYMDQKKYQEAIGAYKNALKNNPKDMETRQNLAYAQMMLKQNPPQQNQDQKKDDKKDDEDKKDQNQDQQDQNQKNDQKENQQNKEQQQKDQQDQQQKQDQQQQDQNEQQQQTQPREQRLSKEEAERLLEALKNEEKKLQEKLLLQKRKGKKMKSDKDW